MTIIPIPKSIEFNHLKFILKDGITCQMNDFSESLKDVLEKDLNIKNLEIKENAQIIFEHKKLNDEAYEIEITADFVKVFAKTNQGAFYAIKTLKQCIKDGALVGCKIKDSPDLKVRGAMLDISRSKVPTLKTLKEMVDFLSDLKYNHLELYVEGFSYEYKSFPNVLFAKNYITVDEYLELETYANQNYIDLVPNQNGFGHMSDWLALDEYRKLAECEEGFFIWGANRKASTLNPIDPKSKKLVQKMYDDMLPYFKSKYFNMNFDEPYELGFGKSKEACQKTSKEEVYINYLIPLYKVVKKYGKTPLIWADVLINHKEVFEKLPKDLILIDWGYTKGYDFLNHAKDLSEHKVKFMQAPGTCTWSTITGRYNDMIGSIKNSAMALKKYGGEGILVTDWGDVGHLQYLPFSYPGFIYGAMLSWSDGNESAILEYLSKIVDKNLAHAIIELSKYSDLEGKYRDYGSRLFSLILWAEHAMNQENKVDFYLNKIKSNLIEDKELKNLEKFLNEYYEKIKTTPTLVQAEIENSINLLLVLLDIQKQLKKYDTTDIKEALQRDILILEAYLKKHSMLWKYRNKEEGVIPSGNRIKWLIEILKGINERSLK